MDNSPGAIRLSSATGRWVILTTVLGSSMALLDSTVVNVALPRIGRELDADMAVLQWTVNAYMVTLAGLLLLGGALGDRYGRRKIFVLGVVWFAVGSLLCGLAPNDLILVAARALQGIGGALLTPGSLALIQATFHPDDRARAVGLWSGLGGVGAAIGPFVGGWLVDGPGWRWVFLLNVPLAALCVPVALKQVPESRDLRAHGRFDVPGAVLGAAALALVTYALIAPSVWVGVVGAVVGVVFVWVERQRPDPMLPLSIFAIRQFTAVNLVTLCVYAAFSGFFFLAALHLQVVAGYSALGAGAALLPTTVLMLLLSAKSGELGGRIGPRIPLTVGPLLCAAGMLLMLRVGEDASYVPDVLPALLVMGLGMVTLVAPLTATVLASVETGRAGLASGINNAAARAAGLLAVAALPLLAGMGPEAYRSAAEFGRRSGGRCRCAREFWWRAHSSPGGRCGPRRPSWTAATPSARSTAGWGRRRWSVNVSRGARPGALSDALSRRDEGRDVHGVRRRRPRSRPGPAGRGHGGGGRLGLPRPPPAGWSFRRATPAPLPRIPRGPVTLKSMSIHENLLGGPPPTHLPDDPEPRELLAAETAPADVAAK